MLEYACHSNCSARGKDNHYDPKKYPSAVAQITTASADRAPRIEISRLAASRIWSTATPELDSCRVDFSRPQQPPGVLQSLVTETQILSMWSQYMSSSSAWSNMYDLCTKLLLSVLAEYTETMHEGLYRFKFVSRESVKHPRWRRNRQDSKLQPHKMGIGTPHAELLTLRRRSNQSLDLVDVMPH